MEALGLRYLDTYRIIVCLEHGFGLLPSGLRLHLQRHHKEKGPLLRAALEEIATLSLATPATVTQPEHGSPRIPGLTIQHGFHCQLPDCNHEKESLSAGLRVVEKHQARVHGVADRRRKQWRQRRAAREETIRRVCMQSLFPTPHYRLFVVQDHDPNPESPPARSRRSSSVALEAVSTQLTQDYTAAREAQQSALQQLPTVEHESQVPGWIRQLGIHARWAGLEKDWVRHLTAAIEDDEDPFHCVQTSTIRVLQAVRASASPGHADGRLSRVGARILNTFEPGRTKTVPWQPVRLDATLKKYAVTWSRLLLFLIRLQRSEETRAEQMMDSFHPHQQLRLSIQRIVEAVESLHTLEVEHAASDGDNEELPPCIQTASRQLDTAVSQCSIQLVRQRHGEQVFRSPVVEFCAFCAMTEHGNWVLAMSFTPFLSAVIHCMQLWLLCYCFGRPLDPRTDDDGALDDLIREECDRHLINTSRGPVAELSYWRLLAAEAKNDTVTHPVTTVSPDLAAVHHLHLSLRLEDWRAGLQALLAQATELLEDRLLLGLHAAPRYPIHLLHDDVGDRRPGRCFLDDPRNRLNRVQDWLFRHLQASPELQARFTQREKGGTVTYRRAAMHDYLYANQRFLRLLAVLQYMGSGLPPRREELLGQRWRNGEAPRNLYLYHGLLAILTGYHKMQYRVGSRPVARFCPPAVGELTVRYLIYVPSLVNFFHRCMQQAPPRAFLFTDQGDLPWNSDIFTRCLQRHTTLEMGCPINSRQWRHIAIALDRRILQGMGCQMYGVAASWGQRALRAASASDSDEDLGLPVIAVPDAFQSNQVRHLQASHTPRVGDESYGNDISLAMGMTDTLLAAFHSVSSSWHGLAGLAAPKRPLSLASSAPPTLAKRPLPEKGSSLALRRQAWTWPAIEEGLRRLFGSHAAVRGSVQRDGLRLIARSRPETLIITPTGSGKTILYVVATLLPRAEVTVVIVPLIALRQDLLRRCEQWGLSFRRWPEGAVLGQLHAVPPLLFVDIDHVQQPEFQALLGSLQRHGRLDRLILEEAHLLLTASHYRERLPLITQLRRYHCPFICLTATLPPSAESELKELLNFTMAEVLRASSDRPNLRYEVRQLPVAPPGLHADAQPLLLDEALRVLRQALAQPGSDPAGRIICFVRRKVLGEELADRLHCHLYHADVSNRDRVLTAWNRGIDSPIMIATSALSAGVDYASVRLILHLDAPTGLLDYAQETGRGGRDGAPADCVILLPPGWRVSWESGFHNNFLAEDRMRMTHFLRSKQCLRRQLTAYLDGGEGISCHSRLDSMQLLCSSCQSSSTPVSREHAAGLSSLASSTVETETARLIPRSRIFSSTEKQVREDEIEEEEIEKEEEEEEKAEQAVKGEQKQEKAETEEEAEEEQAVYDTAAALTRLQAVEAEEGRQQYERRVAFWGMACLPCSFQRRRRISEPHDCPHAALLHGAAALRSTIQLEKYIGCWNCAQPAWICRGKAHGCSGARLVHHACLVALSLDAACGLEMVALLGGPRLHAAISSTVPPSLRDWLGKKRLIFWKEAANMTRLAIFWLDRLDALCVREEIIDYLI